MATLVTASLGLGCGLFDIRDPTPPDTGGGGPPRATPVAPESVLFNLTWAIRYQERGEGQYDESLAESFHLALDQTDQTDTGVDSLNKEQDLEAHRLLSAESSSDSFYFAFGDAPKEGTGSSAYYLDIPYELLVLAPGGDTSLTVRGTADLYLVEDLTGRWIMTRWKDQREDPYTSYGRWHADRVGN